MIARLRCGWPAGSGARINLGMLAGVDRPAGRAGRRHRRCCCSSATAVGAIQTGSFAAVNAARRRPDRRQQRQVQREPDPDRPRFRRGLRDRLEGLRGVGRRPTWAGWAPAAPTAEWTSYTEVHNQIRALDDGGQWDARRGAGHRHRPGLGEHRASTPSTPRLADTLDQVSQEASAGLSAPAAAAGRRRRSWPCCSAWRPHCSGAGASRPGCGSTDETPRPATLRRRRLAALTPACVLSACSLFSYSPTELPAPAAALRRRPPAPVGQPAAPHVHATRPPRTPPTARCPRPDELPAGSTMARIQKRGRLIAGVSADTYLLGSRNPLTGRIEGFDIDMVKAVAKAIFGDENEVPAQGHHRRPADPRAAGGPGRPGRPQHDHHLRPLDPDRLLQRVLPLRPEDPGPQRVEGDLAGRPEGPEGLRAQGHVLAWRT